MFQGDLKNQFTTFWSSGESKVKTALLVTALEEVTNVQQFQNSTDFQGTFGEMLPTLCPELLETEKLDSLVVPLIEKACSGRENLGTTFALESIQDVVQKPVADKCFKVMRSCLLLTFCWTTVQVYKNFTEEGEGTPEEGAEGAEEEGTKTDTQEEEH